MAVNGVYIVLGEANSVVALLNKARRLDFHELKKRNRRQVGFPVEFADYL